MGQRQLLLLGTLLLLLTIGLVIWLRVTVPTPIPQPLPEPIVTPSPVVPVASSRTEIIGQSVEGRNITATTFGSSTTHLLLVGGIHGGYEWNSVLLAYEMIDYFASNTDAIPPDLAVTIIPDLNPDGTYLATGIEGRFIEADVRDPGTRLATGRFNANGVDLNRNFDCKWAPKSSWRGQIVSAGTAPFSEPEAQALRDWVLTYEPSAAVFWHSQANTVYASECEEGVLPETLAVMETYAAAASYGQVAVFDAYPITGDAEGWLASRGIPAVTVELETFNSIEWSRNLAGTMALLARYSLAQ